MDTSQDSTENPTIVLALQRLFYRLQFEGESVDTKELTKSFGWESGFEKFLLHSLMSHREVFTQHDAQELSRLFIDTLETKMKGTKLDGITLNDGFFSLFCRFGREDVSWFRTEHY